jgi:hypothetical protein
MPFNQETRGFYTDNSSGGDYLHGDLVEEDNIVGVAVKQEGASFDSVIADQDVIEDGEEFFLIKRGRVAVDAVFSTGDLLYLNGSTLTSDSASDEVQTVTIDATGGTFTLTFSGQTTTAIAYNASAAAVLSALEALSNIGVGDVAVGKVGSVYTVSFTGALADTNVAQFTANGTSLTGGASTVTVATTTAGGTAYTPVGVVVDDETDPLGRVIVDLDLA